MRKNPPHQKNQLVNHQMTWIITSIKIPQMNLPFMTIATMMMVAFQMNMSWSLQKAEKRLQLIRNLRLNVAKIIRSKFKDQGFPIE